MRSYKNFVKVGGATIGIALVALIYNFFKMYSLVDDCPNNIHTKPCAAYDHWTVLNKAGAVILIVGIVILVIGLVRHNQKKK